MIQTGMSRQEFEAQLQSLSKRYGHEHVSTDVLRTKVNHIRGFTTMDFQEFMDGLRHRHYDHPVGWYRAVEHLHQTGDLEFTTTKPEAEVVTPSRQAAGAPEEAMESAFGALKDFSTAEKRLLLDVLLTCRPAYEGVSWDHVTPGNVAQIYGDSAAKRLALLRRLSDFDRSWLLDLGVFETAGTFFGDQGQHSQAVQYFQKAVRMASWNSIARMSLGVQYAFLGEGTKAIATLEEALRSDPDNARIRFNLEAVRKDFQK